MKQLTVSIIMVLALIAMTDCSSEMKQDMLPNVLLIIVDDLGYKDLGCMGSEYYETPNIDRIAAEGMLFTRGYANGSVCSPSRASIFAGVFTPQHGITDYIGAPSGQRWKRYTMMFPAEYQHHLPNRYLSIPEALKIKNYRTFFAGKWHLGSQEENSLPTDHGFDLNKGGYHIGGPYQMGYFSPFNNPYMEDREDEAGMSLSMKLARETSAFIRQNPDTSFFACLSFYAVHAPVQTYEKKWRKYRDKTEAMGIHDSGFEMEKRLPIRKYQDNPVYAGLLEQTDDAVGHVLNTLEELGIRENTAVIFMSDNGGVSSGDDYATSNSPLRGGKGYQWEGGIRVPFIISCPWTKAKGLKTDVPVTGADLLPTIMEMAEVEPELDYELDGISLIPLLEGEKLPQRALFWHYPHYGNQGGDPNSIIMRGDMKLIHYWEDGHDELYDLRVDINERNNIAPANTDLVSEMRSELMEYLMRYGARYASHNEQFDEETWRNLVEKKKIGLKERYETIRRSMLDESYLPNEDWWGSKIH